jgi:hypothetical protein
MLGKFIDAVDRQRKRFTVYSEAERPDLVDQLATRNVTIDHKQLPPDATDPFVAIREGDEFAGIIELDALETLLTPPVIRPGQPENLSKGYRLLLELLEETVFSSLSRRQLLATSREIEDRALRVSHGTLGVSFQSLSIFETQADLYRRLAEETELDIHIYGAPDWTPPAIEGITYHEDHEGTLGPFWCLAFDGGDLGAQACALVARDREDGYVGFWTYDPELVGEILSTLRSVENGA